MKTIARLTWLCVAQALFLGTAQSLLLPQPATSVGPPKRLHPKLWVRNSALRLRGGDEPERRSSQTMLSMVAIPPALAAAPQWILTHMQTTGPLGLVAWSSIIYAVVLPLTLIQRIWGIGVAYGFSVATAAAVLLHQTTAASTTSVSLAWVTMVYGVRLGAHLLVRDAVRERPVRIDPGSVFSRILFAASLALFYALETTPLLYALNNGGGGVGGGGTRSILPPWVAIAGTGLAWAGALLEAVADGHKLWVKQKDPSDETTFVGPTQGVFRICRHPNYLGEVLFWTGLLVGGASSLGTSVTGWVASLLGWYGITTIMRKSTIGLEQRQQDKYGGQAAYGDWKAQVTAPLIPFVKKDL